MSGFLAELPGKGIASRRAKKCKSGWDRYSQVPFPSQRSRSPFCTWTKR
jgi:hypothetical protein